MKSNIDAIIHLEQATYLDSLLPPRDEISREMEAYSDQHRIPSSDPEVARFLEVTARAMSAGRALEIGTAIGYGAITLARAMGSEGKVVTIDPSEERIAVARDFIRRAGVESQVEIVRGKALDVLPQLKGPFDLAYIDAVKEEYTSYLKLLLPLIRRGGVIIADNVMWKGQVATGRLLSSDQKESTAALTEFNRFFMSHNEIHGLIIPLGDGLAYGIKL
jgi:predicted O-methyltransferase YrrM